jgi:hypothetical protein
MVYSHGIQHYKTSAVLNIIVTKSKNQQTSIPLSFILYILSRQYSLMEKIKIHELMVSEY